MKKAGKLAAFAAALLAFASCSYYTYPVQVEHREASSTGVDVTGKTISVSFVQDSPKDSLFQSEVADAFAAGLEKLYFDGESAIELFSMKNRSGADYSARDTLVQLAVSTDSDVAFLFDRPSYTVTESGDTTYVKFHLYAYDSLGDKDSVLVFAGTKKFSHSDSFPESSGNQLSGYFDNSWVTESYTVYFYDEEKWTDAVVLAEECKWEEALNAWLKIISSTSNTQKRALASYNAGLACYILEKYDLALKWLARAESETQVAQAPSLRRKIINRMP